MSRTSRDKGLRGEHEVAAIFRAHGFAVRGLEGEGDHLCLVPPRVHPDALAGLTIHSEVKRQERLQLWQWIAQLEAECPAGALPLLSFRRNRSPWYALTRLEAFAELLS